MNALTIFNTLQPIILNATGVPTCVLADQKEPDGTDVKSPDGEYAAVRVQQSITQRGQANVDYTNAIGPNLDVDVRAQVIAQCSINFYRGNAMDRAQLMHQANKWPSVSAILFKAKIGWNRTDPVQNLTALQANNYEQRAQVNVYLMYETTYQEAVNSIEVVQVIVDDEKARQLADFTVTGPDAP